jgi:hypothetical protein
MTQLCQFGFGFTVVIEKTRTSTSEGRVLAAMGQPDGEEESDENMDVVVYHVLMGIKPPSPLIPNDRGKQAILAKGQELMRMRLTEANLRAAQAFGS